MIYEIIGWVGTLLILLAYFLVSTNKLKSESKWYQIFNLFGAIGIIVYSAVHNAIPSVGLNAAWLFIAVYGLYKIIGKEKS